MIAALVKDDIVENLIVTEDSALESLQAALGLELVDAQPWGLAIGDLRTASGWTRNAGGEQMLLPPLAPAQYDSYAVAAQRAATAEAAAAQAGEASVEEALMILSGEADE